uniref:Ig-like domain-containing protein n=1 Tax=Oryzias latipes TaxID=8090 RepID=H2LR08_ORYLA
IRLLCELQGLMGAWRSYHKERGPALISQLSGPSLSSAASEHHFSSDDYVFDQNSRVAYDGYGHPQKDDFSALKTQTGCELKINKVKVDHSASYYCICWSHSEKSFLQTEQKPSDCCVRTISAPSPVVSVYPAASRVHVEGSSSLLCLASAMFPPVVQFSWKRQKNNGPLEDLTSEEQLDLRESGYSASILLLHQQEDSSYKYSCSVKHEGGTVEAQTQQGDEGLVTVFNRDSV